MNLPVSEDDRALLAELGRRNDLWSSGEQPVMVSRGEENTTFIVGDYIVRRSADHGAVVREVEILNALTTATCVPTPTPVLDMPELGLFAYRRLPGTPLFLRKHRHPSRVLTAIIDVLTALRQIGSARLLPVDHYSNEEWHNNAAETFRAVQEHLTADQRCLIRDFLGQPPPTSRANLVAQHNDLGAEHILVDDRGKVTGIIDWTDAALTDPARDVGLVYRDLGSGAAVRIGEALNGPVGEDEVHRMRFHARCKWLEDLAFGIAEPVERKSYLVNARRVFDHTFRSAC